MQPITEIIPLLQKPRTIVIVMHQKPDADAMGSSLGLYHILVRLGHLVSVISPTNWADWLAWMPGADKVIDYELNPVRSNELLNKADWIFCLDFNILHRTRKMSEHLRRAPGIRILIDHHQQPETEAFTYGISDTFKSSASEMVFDFIESASLGTRINQDVAECLYAGVMSDTGSFR
ncbi:MAG TPA: DHH family phosphoesterase, partial [Puia sp.]|nr:DHH family phosphoesterase [Puia sp.]